MLPGSPSSPCSRCLPLLSEDSLQNLSSSFTLSQKTRSPNQKSPSFLLFPSFPFLFGPTSTQNILPCNLLCHPPTPLCVLGGWCHHSPNWHGYCQLHSHVSCAAAVSRSRSPHSIRPPPEALQKWREKLQMTKTNIIYVEKKKNKTKRGVYIVILAL